jgi:hypothetical protein
VSPGHGPAGRVDAVVDCFGCSDLLTIGADFDDEYQTYYRENVTHFSAYLGAPGKAPESGLPWSSTTTVGIITDFLHRHLDRS